MPSGVYKHKSGKNSPNYKDGRTSDKNYLKEYHQELINSWLFDRENERSIMEIMNKVTSYNLDISNPPLRKSFVTLFNLDGGFLIYK